MPEKRRLSERIGCKHEGAAWGRASGGPLARAWVVDVSDGGIGMRVHDTSGIVVGDPIRVMRKHGNETRHARVLRVKHDGEGLTIGCEWLGRGPRRDRLVYRGGTLRRIPGHLDRHAAA